MEAEVGGGRDKRQAEMKVGEVVVRRKTEGGKEREKEGEKVGRCVLYQ